jgi:glyceraldehyde 3-phosphate dehydrogenase
MIKVGINGFGRIGRSAFKIILEKYTDRLEVLSINDLTESKVLAHLLQHDSAYGRWGKEVFADEQNIIIEDKKYPITADKLPANLPWGKLGVDVVLECTGRFTKEDDLRQHILAGAKKVILSAPGKEGNIPTYLLGVNADQYHGEEAINNGSCTTNCVAPVCFIINQALGIKKAAMTTTHAVTAEQNLVDGPPPGGKSNDLRRARAAYSNIIPTTTGAAISTIEAIPELKGKFDGRALRVPIIVGSITDFCFVVNKTTSAEEVNQIIKKAAEDLRFKGIMTWSEEPLVSSDIIGNPASAVVDLSLTQVVDGDLVKIFAWYDNEYGYSNRLVEQILNISK